MQDTHSDTPSDIHGKALAINLDPAIYGTFAEIGASQEVARWFLSVGAASGTVAKTISAYDKLVSDEIYGPGTRYVSKQRLLAMLDREYTLLLNRLQPTRAADTRFFVFADTVAARNYQGTNEQHGWLGIRFQNEVGVEPSQVLLHINLRDSSAPMQQDAIGVLGVNLVYAAFHRLPSVNDFLLSLFEQLSIERIEIDVIEPSGQAFADADSGAWCLELLQKGMAHAILFDSEARVEEPGSVLRKRPLVVMRGSFMHPELFDAQLFFTAHQQFLGEQIPCEREAISICELTMRHASRSDQASISEMLTCIRQLARCGCVIVTDFPETYLLSGYLRRHSREPVRFVTTVASLAKIIQERFYGDLPGSLLEGMGKLFAANIKLYVAPMARQAFNDATAEVSGQSLLASSNISSISVNDIVPPRPTLELLQYLLAAQRVVELPPQPRYCESSQRDTKLPRSDADGPFLDSGRNVKIADRGR